MPNLGGIGDTISSLLGIVTKGQATKANSLPVALASDDDLLALIGAVTANPTANTLQDRLKQILTGITVLPLPAGAATAANQPVTAEGTLLTSAARTATTASADQQNPNMRGIILFLNVTAASGTGGLTPFLQAKDPLSGNYVNLNANPTAVTTTGLKAYIFYAGAASTAATVQQLSSVILARTWRVNMVVADSSSYTYSIGYCLLP